MKCRICLILALCFFLTAPPADGQVRDAKTGNSTKKVRPTPSALAAKVGSAVKWEGSFENAQKKSVETGKPIFWYVPTLQNSFMDRKVEIDRYMKAGMFSWPRIIDRINRDFVPVMAIPGAEQARDFDLLPYKFIEPGFLVVDSAGKLDLRCDRLTTQHPGWLESLLAAASGNGNGKVPSRPVNHSPLGAAWTLFGKGQYRQCHALLESTKPNQQLAQEGSAETGLLKGMCRFRLGDHAEAKRVWQQTARGYPDSPLAWKAAAEAEELGPFVRGFEVHWQLPSDAYQKVDFLKVTSSAPASIYEGREKEVWQRGTEFLLGMQRSDGGFVDCDYDFGGSDSLPNVHVAITAICGMALLESDARDVKVQHRQRHNAVELARDFILDETNWNLNDSDELFWAHAYRVRFLAASIRRGWDGKAELQRAVQGLQSMQSRSGSWYHEYPNPLVTSLALIALKEAQLVGAEIHPRLIARGVASLKRNRGQGGFFYVDAAKIPPKLKDRDLTDASAGRRPLCEVALHHWNATDGRQLADAVRVSFQKQSHLLASLKYDDHTSRHDYGGFFFWFDVHSRSDAVQSLDSVTFRTRYKRELRDLIMKLPEIDGCFVDSHEIGRCYGTAMALLTLANTE